MITCAITLIYLGRHNSTKITNTRGNQQLYMTRPLHIRPKLLWCHEKMIMFPLHTYIGTISIQNALQNS